MNGGDEPGDAVELLADALLGADEPGALLSTSHPADPLVLLAALHQRVVRSMLSDLALARRAAAASRAVAAAVPDDAMAQAQAAWSQGSAVLYVPAYAEALAHYDAALAWYALTRERSAELPQPDVRVVQIVRVFCLMELGRYAEAQAAAELAEAWLERYPHPYAALTLQLNRSFLAGSMGDYGRMAELSEALARQAEASEVLDRAAQAWINAGYAAIFLGAFERAEHALTRGIALATACGQQLTAARGVYNRARLLRCTGQLHAALTALHEAQLGLAQAENEAATIAFETAVLAERLRQLPEAIRAARGAADRFARQSMASYSIEATLFAARLALQQQQPSQARKLLERAQRQAAQLGSPQFAAQIALVDAEERLLASTQTLSRDGMRRLQVALGAAVAGVAALRSRGLQREADSGQLTVAALHARLGAQPRAIELYCELADHQELALRQQACAALGELLPAEQALPYLRAAAEIAVTQRRLLPMEEIQARYSSETSIYHLRLMRALREQGHVRAAVESLWVAKVGALIDLRAAADALDDASLRSVEAAKAQLAALRAQEREHLHQAREAEVANQAERALVHRTYADQVASQLVGAEARLTERVRLLHDRDGRAELPPFEAVQAALPPGAVLLEYAELAGCYACWLVGAAGAPQYRPLCQVREVAALLERWKILCHRLTRSDRQQEAQAQLAAILAPLHALLLAPWEGELSNAAQLIIAPAGKLHDLPWAGLLGRGAVPEQLLTLVPSGGLWTPAPVSPSLAPPQVLGYAGAGRQQLAHVANELQAVADSLPNAQLNHAVTAAGLRRLVSPALLHLAAHGQTNLHAPLCSTLELADGPLLLLEAHRLRLRGTRLVTLSACETGVRPEAGDMSLALVGAFLCAGAQAVLASLWPVADAATAAQMTALYQALANGASTTAALQQAQRVIAAEHPLDWMAFQLWAGVAQG